MFVDRWERWPMWTMSGLNLPRNSSKAASMLPLRYLSVKRYSVAGLFTRSMSTPFSML